MAETWHTIGHDKAVNLLRRSLDDGRVSHAYLLAGPHQVGKMRLATDLARAVNCTTGERPCGNCSQCVRIERKLHSDVKVVGLERSGVGRTLIGIDQVREIQKVANLKPFEGSTRVFIFEAADLLSEEAANSLLKTLEEPPDSVLMALLTSRPGELPTTLTSRCQRINLRPVPFRIIAGALETLHGLDAQRANEIGRLAAGRPGWAIEAANDNALVDRVTEQLNTIEEILRGGLESRFKHAARLATSFVRDRETARAELGIWLGWWRDVMLVKEGSQEFVTYLSHINSLQGIGERMSIGGIVRALRGVQDTCAHVERNVNPRLALEQMMLSFPRIL